MCFAAICMHINIHCLYNFVDSVHYQQFSPNLSTLAHLLWFIYLCHIGSAVFFIDCVSLPFFYPVFANWFHSIIINAPLIIFIYWAHCWICSFLCDVKVQNLSVFLPVFILLSQMRSICIVSAQLNWLIFEYILFLTTNRKYALIIAFIVLILHMRLYLCSMADCESILNVIWKEIIHNRLIIFIADSMEISGCDGTILHFGWNQFTSSFQSINIIGWIPMCSLVFCTTWSMDIEVLCANMCKIVSKKWFA